MITAYIYIVSITYMFPRQKEDMSGTVEGALGHFIICVTDTMFQHLGFSQQGFPLFYLFFLLFDFRSRWSSPDNGIG